MDAIRSNDTISGQDLAIGIAIATVLGSTFVSLSSGWSLIVTFGPGVLVTLGTFVWLHRSGTRLPEAASFLPVFFVLLAVQFLHFAEEYITGFGREFPLLYGGAPYPDALFVGFDPDVTIGIWLGYDEKKMIGYGETGTTAALPIWIEIWKAYLEGRDRSEPPTFEAPGNIVFVPVDRATGQPVEEGEAGAIREAFISGTQPQPLLTSR